MRLKYCPYTGQEAIARARERMDQSYKLLTSNCEHFVTEARTGKKQSIQVRQKVKQAAMAAGAAAVIGALVAGAVYVVTRKGKEKEDKEKEDKEKEDEEKEDKKDSDSDVENGAAH